MIRIKLFHDNAKNPTKVSYQFNVHGQKNHVETIEVEVEKSDLEHLNEIMDGLERLINRVAS